MSRETEGAVTRSGPGMGKLLVIAIPLVFALAVASTVVSGLWSATSEEDATPAPRELAGYRLDQTMTGADAIAEISGLHGKDILVAEAWVAHYQENGIVWAARATSEQEGARLLAEMVSGIEKENTPFKGLTEKQFKGTDVYTVTDGRQTHLFYQRGSQVIWVAAPEGAEEKFFSAALEKIS